MCSSDTAKDTMPSPASASIAEGEDTGEICLLSPQNLILATGELEGSP